MIASPFESLAILTLIVGIWLVVIGVFEIVSSFGIRSASKALDNALSGEPARRRRPADLSGTPHQLCTTLCRST
ncbi:hypothetical protein I553_9775 [Mycobacterium xenopi 4042]|uniref:Uncharacterized protein n=1 Tax=Mycobacterium xenopi 4042 TaxID=1299334 RepID=X7YQD5_MYCXE|nr:hypothetical protein I553_9775 [Mycobacterium xenopi 4042]